MKLITEAIKNGKVELTAGKKTFAGVTIQGDTFSSLLFVMALMLLNYILRKYTESCKFTKSQRKINHLVYMDESKLFVKNKKELENLIKTIRIYGQDRGMEFGKETCVMLIMRSGKRQITEGTELSNQERIRTLGEKENHKYGNIGSGHHQTNRNKRKK